MIWNALKFELARMGPDDSLKSDTLIFSPVYKVVIIDSDFVKDFAEDFASDMASKAKNMTSKLASDLASDFAQS